MANALLEHAPLQANILQTILSLTRPTSNINISEAQRLATFRAYPSADKVSPMMLAAEGFISIGSGTDDSVMCVRCRRVKRNWNLGDSVTDVHREMSPDCPPVTNVFGNHRHAGSMLTPEQKALLSNLAREYPFRQAGLSHDNVIQTDAAPDIMQSTSARSFPQKRLLEQYVTHGTAKPFVEINTRNGQVNINASEEARSNTFIVAQVMEGDSFATLQSNATNQEVQLQTTTQRDTERENVVASSTPGSESAISSNESEYLRPGPIPAQSPSVATAVSVSSLTNPSSDEVRSNTSHNQAESARGSQSNGAANSNRGQNEAQPSSTLPATLVSSATTTLTSDAVISNSRESQVNGADGGQSNVAASSIQNKNKSPTYSELGIITERPKRSEYALKLKRLETFGTWPRDHHLTPEELSDAGFYYAGYGDCTRCFYCGGGLRNWEDEDDVWVEHARWFPKCAYIRQLMGQMFVETVQELTKVMEQISFETVIDKMGVSMDMFRLDSKITPLKRDPAVKALVELGYPEKDVLDVATRIKEETTLISADSIVEKLTEEGSRRAPGFESIPSDLKYQTVDMELLNQLKENNNQLRQQLLCKICMDKEVAVSFLPCGHLISCADCSLAMKDCPVCRKNVRGVVRAFVV